jgi:leucyl aminopeptidase
MKPPTFAVASRVPAGCRVLGVPVYQGLSTPAGAGASFDEEFLTQRRFEGRPGQALAVMADDGSTIVAVGVGRRGAVDAAALRDAGAALARQAGAATEIASTLAAAAGDPADVAALVEGIGLGAYRFDGAHRAQPGGGLEQVWVIVPAARGRAADRRAAIEDSVRRGQVNLEATWRTRDWVNIPARDLSPTDLALAAAEAAEGSGVTVEIWEEDRIASERLGGLLGVAAGAEEPPRLIKLVHQPPGRRRVPTVALVGKGITFDSGGLSLKTGAGMMTMKSDMGGAAAVINATVAAGKLGLPVRVVGWVAATENMPSGTAIRPGDVLTARNGVTMEVLNTDAEGRLVLADALSLAVEEKPDGIVDIATLTGGQRVALGDGYAAVMGTDPALVQRCIAAGAAAGEPVWELPLPREYRKQLDSEVADLRNITKQTAASSIMAGLFLQEFTGGLPWAHLDIAGPSWSESDDRWISKGGTGWGARTLLELIRAWS